MSICDSHEYLLLRWSLVSKPLSKEFKPSVALRWTEEQSEENAVLNLGNLSYGWHLKPSILGNSLNLYLYPVEAMPLSRIGTDSINWCKKLKG